MIETGELVISASVGIATYPDDGDTPTELVNAADEAMYRAKRSGRSQVIPVADSSGGL